VEEHLPEPTNAPLAASTSKPRTAVSGASWRSGHSPAGGAPEPDPAPGVARPDRHRGAPDGSEGGPQPDKASPKSRAKSGKPRPRGKKQRTAHSVRLNEHELTII
jgi:hypothetical protein